MSINNRVANSGIISFDLEDLYHPGERVEYDFKQHLFMELILKEKDFRETLKSTDWTQFKDKNVAIFCSVDAIIPTWAFMLLTTYLKPYANEVVMGDLNDLEFKLYCNAFDKMDLNEFKDARIVIKGCSKKVIPNSVFVEFSNRIQPLVKSLMFGEPCSTVPLYKNKNV